MAHDNHAATGPVDPDAVYRSAQGWHAFTKYTKWAVLHVLAILVLMAIFLI